MFTYTARESSEAGLMYYRARYYNPQIGRFASEDPINSINPYAYGGNDPANYNDPLGLKEKCTNPYATQWIYGPLSHLEHAWIDDKLRHVPPIPAHFNLLMFFGDCKSGKPKFTHFILPPGAKPSKIGVQFTFDAGPNALVWGVSVSSGFVWDLDWLPDNGKNWKTWGKGLKLCYDCCD